MSSLSQVKTQERKPGEWVIVSGVLKWVQLPILLVQILSKNLLSVTEISQVFNSAKKSDVLGKT